MKSISLASVGLIACVIAGQAAEPSEDDRIEKFAEAYQTQVQREIDRLQAELRTANKKQRAEVKKRLTGLQKGTVEFWPTMQATEVGQIGLVDAAMKVVSIVDAENMIVRATFSYMLPQARGNPSDGKQAVIMVRRSTDRTLWVRGIETAGHADGSTVKIPDLMEVTGTEKYANIAGGAPTVLVIEPFDVKRLEPYLKAKKSKK